MEDERFFTHSYVNVCVILCMLLHCPFENFSYLCGITCVLRQNEVRYRLYLVDFRRNF